MAEMLAVRPQDGLGLTNARAQELLDAHGPNELVLRRSVGITTIVFRQLSDPVVLVLLVAAGITAAMRDWPDTAVIALVVLLNTALGATQELRSEKAIAALAELTAPRATVIRDGDVVDIPAMQVVPGDLLELRAGDIVPADARILPGLSLSLDEAMLTGESMPRLAGGDEPIFAGTVVVRGHSRALVDATGRGTALGAIAGSLSGKPRVLTPLQRQLAGLGRWLAVAAAVAAVAVAVLNLAAGRGWETSLILALSLAVAAIPESLPAVVTLSLALAARRMAARGVLARNLAAVEALGSVTVLACDKTGTLTEGRMTVAELWVPAADAAGRHALLRAAVLCNDACQGPAGSPGPTDDPVEVALVEAARTAGVDLLGVRAATPRISETPFDAESAMMSTTHLLDDGSTVSYEKGSPEALLSPARSGGAADPAVLAQVHRLAADGHRLLAVSCRTASTAQLLGLVALADPVRPGAAAMIAGFRRAGVRPVMITGDHPLTATAVARQVGIIERAGDLTVLPADFEHDPAAVHGKAAVYARTRPHQKTAIVNGLRECRAIVAMTGDGVNDAPALRAADLGVAVGRGTEVAKQAADVVLTDDDLGVMVLGIAEGRRISDNIGRFLRYGLSGGVAEVLVMLLGPAIGIPVPLQAGQILWINLLTHGLPGVAMGAEEAEPDVLTRGPRPVRQPLVTSSMLGQIGILASLIAGVSLVAARYASHSPQSVIFFALITAQLALAIALRPVRWDRLASNWPLTISVLLNLGLALAALYWHPLQVLLRTGPLSLAEYLVAVAGGVLIAVAARILGPRVTRR
ncbi:MAG: cation-translocating P-type ATPase [Jatrophihabitantaceae bacterium]